MIRPANVDQETWDELNDTDKQFVIWHEQQHTLWLAPQMPEDTALWNQATDIVIDALLKQAGIVFPER